MNYFKIKKGKENIYIKLAGKSQVKFYRNIYYIYNIYIQTFNVLHLPLCEYYRSSLLTVNLIKVNFQDKNAYNHDKRKVNAIHSNIIKLNPV